MDGNIFEVTKGSLPPAEIRAFEAMGFEVREVPLRVPGPGELRGHGAPSVPADNEIEIIGPDGEPFN